MLPDNRYVTITSELGRHALSGVFGVRIPQMILIT
jgi:hypothetical protein